MTEPIVAICEDCDCEYNEDETQDCKLDEIVLDINGTCKSRKLKEEEKP